MSNRKVLVTETHLENIATAIRTKNGRSDSYTPGEMAAAIRAIETEPELEDISIVANGTYTPTAGVDGFSSAAVNVPTLNAYYDDDTIVLTGENVTEQDDMVIITDGRVIHKTITQNGIYQAGDDGAEAYSGVTVNVDNRLGEKTITSDGDYDAVTDGLNGYRRVSVRVGSIRRLTQAGKNHNYPCVKTGSVFSSLGAFRWTAEA